jgi:hypothetical protein
MSKTVLKFLPLAAALAAGLVAAQTPAQADDGKYQLMKAKEDRVWRLNKETGEIAVCTLTGERLLCTTSSDAATPPKQSYDQMRADKAAQEKALAEERRKRENQELKILERILAFFRDLITMTREQDAGK